MENKEFFVLYGGNFTPKALFAQKFCEKYHFKYISIGKLLLEMSAMAQENNFPPSYTDEDKVNITDLSQLVLHRQDIPSKLVAWLISFVINSDEEYKSFIVDGFPRNIDEYLDLDDIEATCKGAISLHIDDLDMKAKFIEQREKTGMKHLTDQYIFSSIANFHRTHDEIFTKFMIQSSFINIDSKLSIDEMIDNCYKQIKENESDDDN